ncbi:MAG: glycosyltransferase family 4 protein [Planctomycetes bacterium]|nr:glycosyltransferase family 4 protein [Planctomycetota bacterium]
MRILFVNPFYLPDSIGGGQLHLYYLARALRRRGHEVALFRRDADPARPDFDLRRDQHEGLEIAAVNYAFRDCDRFERIYSNPSIDAVFRAELARWKPDVVHIHHLTCLSTGILGECRRAGVPAVLSLHDFWMGCPRGQRIRDDLALCETIDRATCATCCAKLWPGFFPDPERSREELARYDAWLAQCFDQAALLVSPSPYHARAFAAHGVDPARIEVVENGLPFELFQLAPKRRPRERGSPLRIGFLGSVIPSKGVHVLIDAVQRLPAEQVELAIHGECFPWHLDTTYEQRLRAQIRGTHRIALTGRYEHAAVPQLLAQLDALVIPGLWYEAFCLTIREGFLANVPVLASRLGAMAEAIDDGRTGLLFQPGDAEDLARALKRLLDDAALGERLAAAPKAVVSVDAMADRFLRHYHLLAQAARR